MHVRMSIIGYLSLSLSLARWMYVYIHTHTYTLLCVCISVYMYICIHAYIYIYTHTPSQVCMHTHICTCAFLICKHPSPIRPFNHIGLLLKALVMFFPKPPSCRAKAKRKTELPRPGCKLSGVAFTGCRGVVSYRQSHSSYVVVAGLWGFQALGARVGFTCCRCVCVFVGCKPGQLQKGLELS